MNKRYGYVGIGNMGRPMAANLARAGHEIIIGDLDKVALETFAQEHKNARPANGLKAIAQDSDAVFTCLPNGNIVREVVLGEGGLIDGMGTGDLIVDMSSSSPIGTMELGKELARRGIRMIDAPVSGGIPRAIDGSIAIMVGGQKEDINKIRPALEVMGGKIFETGGLGSAHAMKAINNVLSATNLLVSIEALVIGKKFGLNPAEMVDILNFSSGKNSATETKIKEYVLNRKFNSGFSLDLMIKDLETALELANEMNIPWFTGNTTHGMYQAARNQLIENSDNSDVARWIETNAGVRL